MSTFALINLCDKQAHQIKQVIKIFRERGSWLSLTICCLEDEIESIKADRRKLMRKLRKERAKDRRKS